MGRPALSFLELAGYNTQLSFKLCTKSFICPFNYYFHWNFLEKDTGKFYHFAHPTRWTCHGGLSPFIMVLRWHCSVWLANIHCCPWWGSHSPTLLHSNSSQLTTAVSCNKTLGLVFCIFSPLLMFIYLSSGVSIFVISGKNWSVIMAGLNNAALGSMTFTKQWEQYVFSN